MKFNDQLMKNALIRINETVKYTDDNIEKEYVFFSFISSSTYLSSASITNL